MEARSSDSRRLAVPLLAAVLVAVVLAGCRHVPFARGYSLADDAAKVRAVLKRIDADVTDTSIYVDDVVHMAQGSRAVTSKVELHEVLTLEATHGRSDMTHELVTIHSYPDMVLTRGRVKGTWRPAAGGSATPFETNNVIAFRRQGDGSLKVWQVIFNRIDLDRR